jgi:L-threonylcarbamoyladenylate synthase
MPQVALIDLVRAARQGDRLICFPTDTVPALAVRPDRADLIFTAKQRSQTKPLILMGADINDLWQFVWGRSDEQQVWQQVAAEYLPGALTLVLPASDRLPLAVNPTDPTTIGIRVPNRAIARHILSQTGPLATTSVNRSGEPPLQDLAEINVQFPEVLTLLPTELAEIEHSLSTVSSQLEISEPDSGVPSTVIRWIGDGWQVLRQGEIRVEPIA